MQRTQTLCDLHLNATVPAEVPAEPLVLVLDDGLTMSIDLCSTCRAPFEELLQATRRYGEELPRAAADVELSRQASGLWAEALAQQPVSASVTTLPRQTVELPDDGPDYDADATDDEADAGQHIRCEVKGCGGRFTGERAMQAYSMHLRRGHGIDGTIEKKRAKARRMRV